MPSCYPSQLLMLRTRGLAGPFGQGPSGGPCIKSVGNAYAQGGPLAGAKPTVGIVDSATQITLTFSQCIKDKVAACANPKGISVTADGVPITVSAVAVFDKTAVLTVATVQAGDDVKASYDDTGGCLVECNEPLAVLGVGNAGFLYGFRPTRHPTSQFGSLTPDVVGGLSVYQFTANSSNNIVVLDLGAAGGEQIGTEMAVVVDYDGGRVSLAWTGARYEATDAGLTAAIVDNLGSNVLIGFDAGDDYEPVAGFDDFPVSNQLTLEGNFILLETGGKDIVLLEDDSDGSSGIQTEDAV